MIITSLKNESIKSLVKLRNRRERDKTHTFIIEGYRELLRALEGKQSISHLYFCPELFLGENEPALIQAIEKQGGTLTECSRQVFEKISYRDRPDGLLGVAPQTMLSLNELSFKNTSPFLVVAEGIEKPGNLGTILRSSDAVGVDGLIVCDKCTDIHNPNVVRASVGTLFTVPIVESSSRETIDWLRKQNIKILAATPHATANYSDVDLTQPIAIALGTEQYGLSDLWMQEADIQVRIPMMGVADSLNVAMATTVLLYETLRQRGTDS